MNLHNLVRGAIGAVNPELLATVRMCTGYTTAANGARTPSYTDFPGVPVQVQALSYSDLMKVDGLNIQGNRSGIYLNGNWDGLVRRDRKGGDLIVIPSGPSAGVWLVAVVLENWPDWTKVAVTQQLDAP